MHLLYQMDDILTGRKPSTKNCEQFALPDSEYADDTGVLFTSRESVEIYLPSLIQHFLKFGLEVHFVLEKGVLNLKSYLSPLLIVFTPTKYRLIILT